MYVKEKTEGIFPPRSSADIHHGVPRGLLLLSIFLLLEIVMHFFSPSNPGKVLSGIGGRKKAMDVYKGRYCQAQSQSSLLSKKILSHLSKIKTFIRGRSGGTFPIQFEVNFNCFKSSLKIIRTAF